MYTLIIVNRIEDKNMLSNSAKVYAWRNQESGRMYVGLEPPGKSHYISSSGNDAFWEDYAKGILRRSVLYEGDLDTAKTLEWFALRYGTKTADMYNYKNNAHCVDESLLTSEMKQIVVDYLEGGEALAQINSYDKENQRMLKMLEDIKNDVYETVPVSKNEVSKYSANQVRVEAINPTHVRNLVNAMEENPERTSELFDPIIVIVQQSGDRTIGDGNSRRAAAMKVRGMSTVPVKFINDSDFGEDEKTRKQNYKIFGLLMNKQDEKIRLVNNDEDIKRQIHNFIYDEGLDISKPLQEERARKLIYDRFSIVVPSKKKLSGLIKSVQTRIKKDEAALKYQTNLIAYDDAFFERYEWETYEKNDVATIHATMSKAKHGQAFGYICRRMKNIGANKGAIILHYTSKPEIVEHEDGLWLKDLKDTIEFHNLDIVIDVLPAFE